MIECLCIDDSNRPKQIPLKKWIKKNKKYHVVYTTYMFHQKQIGVHLAEIDLTENEFPYEFFLSSRFAFRDQDFDKLLQMINDCNELDFSIEELLKQTERKNYV
jgi:hypothetical protein